MEDIDTILIDRLMSFCDFRETGMQWDNSYITLEEIRKGIEIGLPEQHAPYTTGLLEIDSRSKEWHIGRIIYFINNPEKITPLDIDNECHGMTIMPVPIIEDGHHRLFALLYLRKIECEVRYSGLVSVLEYLKGETDII